MSDEHSELEAGAVQNSATSSPSPTSTSAAPFTTLVYWFVSASTSVSFATVVRCRPPPPPPPCPRQQSLRLPLQLPLRSPLSHGTGIGPSQLLQCSTSWARSGTSSSHTVQCGLCRRVSCLRLLQLCVLQRDMRRISLDGGISWGLYPFAESIEFVREHRLVISSLNSSALALSLHLLRHSPNSAEARKRLKESLSIRRRMSCSASSNVSLVDAAMGDRRPQHRVHTSVKIDFVLA